MIRRARSNCCAERDILRAEAVRYAWRLDGAGHGFNVRGGDRASVERVYERIAAAIRQALTS